MNIAHLLPYSAVFPLKKHNGRYEWALRLARLQVAAGHTVTMYGGPGSTDAATPALQWRTLPASFSNKTLDNIALLQQALATDSHDIYHSHFDYLHYFVADTTTRPVLFTQHWFPTDTMVAAQHYNTHNPAIGVPVTDYMAAQNHQLGLASADRIYHGIDLDMFSPQPENQRGRFVCVGRIAPHKGVREVVSLAHTTGQKLDIIGKINASDQAYWNSFSDLIDGANIHYLGSLPQAEVASHLASAKALIFISQAVEAFGQTIIEAQACGTPVITNDIGAARELVQNGITGFVTTNDTELRMAIDQITNIDPQACRNFAEHFDVTLMAQRYESLYRQLIARTPHKLIQPATY